MPRPRSDGTPARQPNKRKLTDLFVRTLKPGKRAQQIWDEKQPGLAIAVQPTGHRAWKVVYRYGGRPRWYTVGSVDAIGLADARRIAGKVMLQVAEGIDPQAERMAQRGRGTFEELATRYRDEFASKRNKSWRQPDALVRRYILPSWGKLRACDIKRADVAQVLARLGDTPALANQVLAAASVIFSWAIKQEIVTLNPCRLIDRNATKSRERVLSDSELPRFWSEFSPALKLVLLTGQRPGEISHMRREHIAEVDTAGRAGAVIELARYQEWRHSSRMAVTAGPAAIHSLTRGVIKLLPSPASTQFQRSMSGASLRRRAD